MKPEETIVFAVRRLANCIKREVFGTYDGVTAMHGWLIGYLYNNRDKDIFQRDIESQFSIRPSTVTVIVQKMEKNGLIERRPVEYDARLKKIVLTEKANHIHQKVEERMEEVEGHLRKDLSEDETKIFFELISKMIIEMEVKE
ncbi:MAG: MarR family transcriptional regulator [Bacillota bacterium]|nr:MarR family transcriptional regulator [Bacillota bacterium]